MIAHLEPDILECEVKWALGSITKNKASGSDGIPVELFQILKDDAVNVLHSVCQPIWETQQWPQDWKKCSFQSQRKAIPKNVQTTTQLCSSHMLARSCSKSFKLGFNNTWTKNFQIFKLDLDRHRNQRSNCQHLLDHRKSKRIPEKHLLLLYWLCQTLWLCKSQHTLENSSRDGNTRPPYLPPEKPECRSRSNSSNQTRNNRLVQNWKRSTSRLYVTLLI